EAGGTCADGNPTQCDGFDPIAADDCTVCCDIPEDQQTCPPEGCMDDVDNQDCPPNEDCSYTETCPDGVCADGEDCTSCPIDCGECAPSCGDGTCSLEETCRDCPDDCGACAATCGDGICNVGTTPADGETC